MQQLEYEAPRSSTWSWSLAILLTLPVVATLLLLCIEYLNGSDEPYGLFNWFDAITQVGGSGVVIAFWLAWAAFAWVQRVRWRVLLSVAVWAMLNSWEAYDLGVGYFSEPWAHP